MNISEKVSNILETIKPYFKNKGVQTDLSYVSFIVSLLPIPGVQQSAQIADRILSSKVLKKQLDELWKQITETNKRITDISGELGKIKETATTIKHNSSLDKGLNQLIQGIVSDIKNNTEWVLETENWSYQEILNSTVKADFAAIIARNKSSNVVENTEIRAIKTHLHASNKSQNFFDGTKFSGGKGSVGMNGITTKGDIEIKDSGIGLGPGGSLIFGVNPNIVRGVCPFCDTEIQADKRQLASYSMITCPKCSRSLPFSIN